MVEPDAPHTLPNGAGAAAFVAAGLGCLALGVFALASDALAWAHRAFNIWAPSGPLSGVSTAAVAVWLAGWLILDRRWRGRDVDLRRAGLAAFVMLAAGLLLTFPPAMDWLQGK
jgi:hypothetical protein